MRSFVFRSLSAPLIKRFEAPLEVPVTGGSRMIVHPPDYVGRTLAISGTWERQVTAAFRALLTRGDVCVDVGATIGYFTLLASKLVGPRGHVYALEPSPRIHAGLRANLELNRVTNVTTLRVAAADTEDAALVYEGTPGNRGGTSLHPARAFEGREVTSAEPHRLDSLLTIDEIARLRLAKIDVEGYELPVLRGLEGVYERGGRPAVIVELFPKWSGDDAPVCLTRFCEGYGLDAFVLPRESVLDGREDAPYAPVQIRAIAREQQELLLLPRTGP
jgi:FkbM family methyltransferase